MKYYDKKQYIMQVDENDEIIDKVEKFEAHENKILHRAITIALIYDGKVVCQHRRHPLFDQVLDLTGSSHQVYLPEKDRFQTNEECVISTLEREWGIPEQDIKNIKYMGKVQYEIKDKFSKYYEIEWDHYLSAEIDYLPEYIEEYAYGMSLLTWDEINNLKPHLKNAFAKWVTVAIDEGILKDN